MSEGRVIRCGPSTNVDARGGRHTRGGEGRGRFQFVSQEPRPVSEGRVMLLWAVNKR